LATAVALENEDVDLFDIEAPSPLPRIARARDGGETDAITRCERTVARLDADGAAAGDRATARIELSEAWMRVGAVAPALEASRQAANLAASDPRVLGHLADLLARSGSHREAATVLEQLAQTSSEPAAWLTAARALARAESDEELERILDAACERFPESAVVRAFSVDAARRKPGDAKLPVRLAQALVHARSRNDVDAARRLALDAWLESQAASGARDVVDLLMALGHPHAAQAVAVDAAARTIQRSETAETAALLQMAAHTTESTSDAGDATALLAVAALFTREAAVRDRSRDLFADSGRDVDLAARLRIDARREREPTRAAAAWKGVAQVERRFDVPRAAMALGEAAALQPDDPETLAALSALTDTPEGLAAVCDSLAWATRAELGDLTARRELLALRVELESRTDDAAGALDAATRAWKSGLESAHASVQRYTEHADDLYERAESALQALESPDASNRPEALQRFLMLVARAPGAIRDLARASHVLGPVAGTDGGAAALWLRLCRRLGDRSTLVGALRRIATRSTVRLSRARAAVELAEFLDQSEPEAGAAFEVLEQVLDEQPDAVDAVATLVALAEHSTDLRVDRAAIAAMSRAAHDPRARDLLTRLSGAEVQGPSPLASLARVLDAAPTAKDRVEALRAWRQWLGDSPSLLARLTRALMAAGAEARESAEVARSFATACPMSPEATIAWFGTAGVVGDPQQIADAAIATLHGLTAARDAAHIAKAALTRLFSTGETALALRVARQTATVLGLADRGLRAAVVDYVQRQTDPDAAIELLEAAVAGAAGQAGEQAAALRSVARWCRERGDATGESYALRRLVALVPGDGEALGRLSELLASSGDLQSLARTLALQVSAESQPERARAACLTLAAVHFALGERDVAIVTLDRMVDQHDDPTVQADAMRALLAMNEHEAAVTRLTKWAEKAEDRRVAVQMYRAAALIVRSRGSDPARAIVMLRAGLTREPESPDLLLFAEDLATENQIVRSMLAIYSDLDAAAAGEHGRRALAYRRAAFLERVGETDEALAGFVALFERAPVVGATLSAIDRLAQKTGRLDVVVACHRRLAETSPGSDGKVRHLLAAAAIARDGLHDRRAALELTLLAHDERRDAETTRAVIDAAGALRALDAQTFRSAVETVFDRTMEVAAEVWDDERKRDLALRAAEIAATELIDPARFTAAAQLFVQATEDPANVRGPLEAMVERVGAAQGIRDALHRVLAPTAPARSVAGDGSVPSSAGSNLVVTRPPPAVAAPDVVRALAELAKSGRPADAIRRAREELVHRDEDALRVAAIEIARESGDAAAEVEFIDQRLGRTLDSQQRKPMILRSSELLRTALGRPADARRLLDVALAAEPDDDDILRGAHDAAEHAGDWPAVSELLARRIARATDRAEARALRLHRAAVLEQRFTDVAGSIAELDAILEDEPAHRPALRYLADLHLREERFRDAGECFARAAATTPMRAEAADLLSMAGDAFAHGADFSAAEAQYKRALDLDPRAGRALEGLVAAGRRGGRLEDVERALAQLAEDATHDRDRVALRVAAARAALDAGALFRAKGHLDAVRRFADPAEIADLDAVLQAARDADRPISQTRMPAVRGPVSSATDAANASRGAESRSATASPIDDAAQAIASDAGAREVPQTIDPAAETIPPIAPSASSDEHPSAAAIPLARTKSRSVTPPPVPSTGVRRIITPRPVAISVPAPIDAEVSAPPEVPTGTEPEAFVHLSEAELRDAAATGDDGALQALAIRLARNDSGRAEAARLQRQRFQQDPTRVEALEALVGLYQMQGMSGEARGIRAIIDVLSRRSASVTPPDLHGIPDLPADAAARMTQPPEHSIVADVGAMLWEALGNSLKRDISSYGVTGVDRIAANAPTDVARMFASAARVLQVQRVALFVRNEVAGGALPARTQPPSVILAAALAADTSVSRFMLAHALEATRPSYVLVSTLDAETAQHVVRAAQVAFGTPDSMSGTPSGTAQIARELVSAMAPRTQRRAQELLAELDRLGRPFTYESWLNLSECARVRAGLLVSGEFEIAARIVVSRHRPTGGEPDVLGALASVEPLRDLARFAVGEQYLLSRWRPDQIVRPRR